MLVRLEVIRGARTKEVRLRLPSIIGRGGDAKLKLPASTVSRHHCEIYEYEGQIAIRDLASSNGTIVNGHKIKGPTFVTPQDELTIGPLTARLHPIEPDDSSIADTSEPKIWEAEVVEVEETIPSFEELPAEVAEPEGAMESNAVHDNEVATESDEESVLKYAEPQEKAGRSFVGITPAEEQPESVSDAPVFDGIEEQQRGDVRSDDTSLNEFFKNLDE